MTNFLVALIGPSGSGKTTIANALYKHYRWKSIESYTTRPKRSVKEKGHTFITEEEFNKTYPLGENSPDFVAYTVFNGYRYFATKAQVDECDVYVIDPAGMKYLEERYTGPKKIISIWLETDKETCKKRMLMRGDSADSVAKRLIHDEKTFSDNYKAQCDHVVKTEGKEIDYLTAEIAWLVINHS